MASLTHKIINGNKYYYARICKRVNGKPKIVRTIYLGSVKNMIKNSESSTITRKIQQAKEVYIVELGATAALLDIAERLKLVATIDRNSPKKNQGPSVGQYILIAAINRAVHPTSKQALSCWFQNTAGPRLIGVKPKELSSQAFWNHMDKLSHDVLMNIENDLFMTLIHDFKVDLNCLLYDGTNFYTYINTKTESELAKRGHNKQKRNDLRQVSLGMMVSSDFHIPLMHMVYGGNINDSKQFGSVINELITRYKHLIEVCPHITLVFDKGNNSEKNFESFKATNLHFVGSLKLNQCKELVNIPLDEYKKLSNRKLESLKIYRTRYKVFAEERTVLITYNENLLAGQLQGIEHNIIKCKKELKELQQKLKYWASGKISKGKKPTFSGTENKIKKTLKREYMNKIIKTHIFEIDGFMQIKYHVDQKAIALLRNTVLGKTILFTDNHDWTGEQIINAYRGQYKIEHAFRDMKNPHFLGWNPRFHWTDQKIRVHAFYCVIALTLVSLLRRELNFKGVKLSAECLMKNLGEIRETISIYPEGKNQKPRLSYSISHLNKTQQNLYDILSLSRFRKN